MLLISTGAVAARDMSHILNPHNEYTKQKIVLKAMVGEGTTGGDVNQMQATYMYYDWQPQYAAPQLVGWVCGAGCSLQLPTTYNYEPPQYFYDSPYHLNLWRTHYHFSSYFHHHTQKEVEQRRVFSSQKVSTHAHKPSLLQSGIDPWLFLWKGSASRPSHQLSYQWIGQSRV